ncbi:hypothetical protein JXB01_02460 [Candidatus Micrarchaeota archaeon]|nr:hypothetical protein [Candidatus Micrarchaeota archaeon]
MGFFKMSKKEWDAYAELKTMVSTGTQIFLHKYFVIPGETNFSEVVKFLKSGKEKMRTKSGVVLSKSDFKTQNGKIYIADKQKKIIMKRADGREMMNQNLASIIDVANTVYISGEITMPNAEKLAKAAVGTSVAMDTLKYQGKKSVTLVVPKGKIPAVPKKIMLSKKKKIPAEVATLKL